MTVEDLLSAIEAHADGYTVALNIWRNCGENNADIVRVKLSSSDKLQRVIEQQVQLDLEVCGSRCWLNSCINDVSESFDQ